MGTVSSEEKHILLNGFILMIKEPLHNPDEHMLAVIWGSDYRYGKRAQNIDEELELSVLPTWLYELFKERHDDWVEEMSEETLQQYRERQMTHIVLGRE